MPARVPRGLRRHTNHLRLSWDEVDLPKSRRTLSGSVPGPKYVHVCIHVQANAMFLALCCHAASRLRTQMYAILRCNFSPHLDRKLHQFFFTVMRTKRCTTEHHANLPSHRSASHALGCFQSRRKHPRISKRLQEEKKAQLLTTALSNHSMILKFIEKAQK